MIERQDQEPTLDPTIHALAKPVTKAAAWGLTGAVALALAAAAIRTLTED